MAVYFTYDGVSSVDYIDVVIRRQRLLTPPSIERSISVPEREGAYFFDRSFDIVPIIINTLIKGTSESNLIDKLRNLSKFLHKDEPKKLIFSDENDKYFNALFVNKMQVIDRKVWHARVDLEFHCFDPFAYTIYQNLNANPSIEVDTSGYSLVGSTISRDTTEYYHGVASLKVITDNNAANEGWVRDVTAETSAGTEYTFSDYLKGSGTVILRFWDEVSGYQNGAQITLTGTWTRYSLTRTFGVGSTVRRLYVVTDLQQDITFYSDAIMHSEGPTLYPFDMNSPGQQDCTSKPTTIPINNEGNYKACPIWVITFTQAQTYIKLYNDGNSEIFNITRAFAIGDKLKIDTKSKIVYYDSGAGYAEDWLGVGSGGENRADFVKLKVGNKNYYITTTNATLNCNVSWEFQKTWL